MTLRLSTQDSITTRPLARWAAAGVAGDGEELGLRKRLRRDLEDLLPPWPHPPSSPRPSDSASPCSCSPTPLDGEEEEEESSSPPVSIAFDLCCLWD